MKKIITIILLLLIIGCNKIEEELVLNNNNTEININDMGKIINAYAGFTATDLKNRAEIPNQSDMIVNGSTVDCSNISITDIKNVLGDSATSVAGLCQSPNVNIWSGFAPTEWYLSGSNLLNRVKTPYTLSSFAGYNHNAIPAG